MGTLSNLSIAPALPDDLPALTELAVASFGESFRTVAAREFPTGLNPGTRSPLYLLVAKSGDTPIGMVGLLEDYMFASTYCLCWLCVAPAYRNQGLGSTLVQAALHGARLLITTPTGTLTLVTAESKIPYYTRFGFSGATPLHIPQGHTEPHTLLALPLTQVLP